MTFITSLSAFLDSIINYSQVYFLSKYIQFYISVIAFIISFAPLCCNICKKIKMSIYQENKNGSIKHTYNMNKYLHTVFFVEMYLKV